MFAIERQRMIKKLLTQNQHVSVTELRLALNVSEVTIRRDLEKLENEQFLMRTHGGAVIRSASTALPAGSFMEPAERAVEAVRPIAGLAVDMVQNGSIIYLDGGPICRAMAQQLTGKQNVIVLTCSLHIATLLLNRPGIQVIIPGGEVYPSGTIYSPSIHSTFNTMHIGIAFFEPAGFSGSGFTVRDHMTGSLLQAVGSISDQSVFLCDPQAYGSISFFQVGELKQADSIITAAEIDSSFRQTCLNEHIKLFTAYSL